jgi:hypothetical protein
LYHNSEYKKLLSLGCPLHVLQQWCEVFPSPTHEAKMFPHSYGILTRMFCFPQYNQ